MDVRVMAVAVALLRFFRLVRPKIQLLWQLWWQVVLVELVDPPNSLLHKVKSVSLVT
jgi:hypothetical protein